MTNDTPDSEMAFIKISKGQHMAYVSPEDKEFAEPYTWSAVKSGRQVYAVRSMKGDNRIKIYLAREIMARMIGRDLVKGESVRHKDRMSLNCTRDNLILKGNK